MSDFPFTIHGDGMQKHFQVTRERLKKFASKEQLGAKIYTERVPVKLSVFSAPGRISYSEALQGDYRSTAIGERFGPAWSTHWFKVEIDIPQEWHNREVHLLWDSASEGCIYRDGQPVQGLTGSSNGFSMDILRGEYILTKNAVGGEKIELYIESAVNGLFGVPENEPRLLQMGLLKQAEIAVFNRAAWDLLWDYLILADMAVHLPINTPRGGQALFAANAMVNVTNLEDPSTWPAARAIAANFFSDRNGGGQHNVSAVGHAHIDTAWLWPLAETRRKCVRTFSTALQYMDEYPDYKFACSQAQQYEWMKESHPVYTSASSKKYRLGSLFRQVGPGWSLTVIFLQENHWCDSSCSDSAISDKNSALLVMNFGNRMCLDIQPRCPRLCGKLASTASSPLNSPGVSSTNYPATPSGGKAWMAAAC
jgi:alpha-mannosidase